VFKTVHTVNLDKTNTYLKRYGQNTPKRKTKKKKERVEALDPEQKAEDDKIKHMMSLPDIYLKFEIEYGEFYKPVAYYNSILDVCRGRKDKILQEQSKLLIEKIRSTHFGMQYKYPGDVKKSRRKKKQKDVESNESREFSSHVSSEGSDQDVSFTTTGDSVGSKHRRVNQKTSDLKSTNEDTVKRNFPLGKSDKAQAIVTGMSYGNSVPMKRAVTTFQGSVRKGKKPGPDVNPENPYELNIKFNEQFGIVTNQFHPKALDSCHSDDEEESIDPSLTYTTAARQLIEKPDILLTEVYKDITNKDLQEESISRFNWSGCDVTQRDY
jgi:hypothetical protein